MKTFLNFLTLLSVFLLLSCGGKEDPNKPSYGKKETIVDKTPASQRVDLTNKGVGPIKSIALSDAIDQNMVAEGAKIYKNMCTACHKVDKKFIGPSPKGILERRTPEWVMNMILKPQLMVQEDPLAKQLLIEFNGSPMANQNLKEEEARAVLEFFRTLK